MLPKRKRQKVLRQYRQRRTTELPPEMRPRQRETRRRRPEPLPRPSLNEVASSFGKNRSRVIGALGAALSAALLLFLALTPRYYVQGASIQGNSRVSADEIYAKSGIDGRHVFQVDQDKVAANLELLPQIERAQVGTGLPNRVRILIEETPLALLWETPAGRIAIDRRGRLASLPDAAIDLPLVKDEVGLLALPLAGLPDDIVEAGRRYAETFGQPLVYRERGGFVHSTREGWEVWLGTDAEKADTQARRLEALRPTLAERARLKPVEMIDLRFEQWYYRMQGESP